MSDPTKFIWVNRIHRRWVLNAQALMGITFYAALAILLLGLVTPKQWHLDIAGGVTLVLAITAGAAERWMFFNLIKCPQCGFNATYGKTTDRPLNYRIAWARLEEYKACPRCGYEG